MPAGALAILGTAKGAASSGVPAASNSWDFRSTSNNLPANATLTRSSTAVYQTRQGYYQTVANNQPRVEWGISNATGPYCKGLLIEPAATNLVKNSDDLSQAVWTKSFVTVTANQATGPFGTPSLAQFANGQSTWNECYQPIAVTVGNKYVITAHVRLGTLDSFIVCQMTELGPGYGAGVFDLAAVVTGNTFGVDWQIESTSIEPMGDGALYRLTVVATPLTTKASNVGLYLQHINASNGNWQATPNGTGFVGSVQVEEIAATAANAVYPTSYIPNASSSTTATRAADNVSLFFGVTLNATTSAGIGLPGLTASGTTCTASVAAGHGFTTGQSVTIAGAAPAAYNGTFTITVTSPTQFTYTAGSAPGTSPATGTITAALASQVYDILVTDPDGAEWRSATVTNGSYTLTPRLGKRYVQTLRAWRSGALSQSQKDALFKPTAGGAGGGTSTGTGGTTSSSGLVPPLSQYGVLAFGANFGTSKVTSDAVTNSTQWGNTFGQKVFWQPLPTYGGGQITMQTDHVDLTMTAGPNTVFVESKFAFDITKNYYLEGRMKVPTNVSHIVPAFWLYANSPDVIAGRNGGEGQTAEIDLMETFNPIFGNDSQFFTTTHNAGHTNKDQVIITVPTPYTNYNVIAMELRFAEKRLRLWSNGQPASGWLTYDWASYGGAPPAIVLDIDSDALVGGPGPGGAATATMSIDYVRAWQEGVAPATSPIGGAGVDKTAAGWTLTFLDDFTGVQRTDLPGSPLYFDRTKWTSGLQAVSFGQDNGGDGSRFLGGNVEQQYYLDPDYKGNGTIALADRINPFSIGTGGILNIESGYIPDAKQTAYYAGGYRVFYSGCINTCNKFSQFQGLFEMRAKFPPGLGSWPAFWLLAQTPTFDTRVWPPEIDVLEAFPKLHPTQAHSGIQITSSSGAGPGWQNLPNGARLDDGFHIFSMSWDSNNIVWYIDYIEVGRTPTPSTFTYPMFMLVNVAVGGEWYRGESGAAPGDYMALVNAYKSDTTQMPYRSQIDWVRVYKRTPSITATPKVMTVGDSITNGDFYAGAYRPSLDNRLKAGGISATWVGRNADPAGYHHEGYSGYGIVSDHGGGGGIQGLIAAAIAANPPDELYLMIGTNDISGYAYGNTPQSASTTASRLSTLLDTIYTAKPDIAVVVMNCTPRQDGIDVTAYNALIPGVVSSKSGAGKRCYFCDVYTGFPTSTGYGDGTLHPNATGYDFMAGNLYTTIRTFS